MSSTANANGPQSEAQPTPVWEKYCKKAKKRDATMVKDWNSSINGLLLFAALFAAVTGSICIESRKLLEEDQQGTTNQLLRYLIEKESGNSATFSPLPTPFQPAKWKIATNALLFGSLVASILAAIAAVTCLQWVDEYDNNDSSTAEQRALRSHYRYRSVEHWWMHQLIASLPIILYLSVALFFTGLAVWFLHVSPVLSAVPFLALGIWALGYFTTTALAVIYPSAPFRTPVSRLLFRIISLSIYYLWISYRYTKALHRPMLQVAIKPFGTSNRKYRNQLVVVLAKLSRELKEELSQVYTWMPPGRDCWQSMHTYIREAGRVRQDRTIRLAALTWLANSIEVVEHSEADFVVLLEELNQIEESNLREWSAYAYDAPWSNIFNLVLGSAIRRDNQELIKKRKKLVVGLLLKMSRYPDLFQRMTNDMSAEVMIEFMEKLRNHGPATREEAIPRLQSLMHLWSSELWENMDASKQPSLASLSVISDCLEVMGPIVTDVSVSWIFTLCHIPQTTSNFTWPNAEYIGHISHAFKNETLRQGAVRRYIQFADSILEHKPVPDEEEIRWRWHSNAAPTEMEQLAILHILGEHLLRIMIYFDSRDSTPYESSCQLINDTHVNNPILSTIIEAYQFPRDFSKELPPPDDPNWSNEAWIYSKALQLGLRVKWESTMGLRDVKELPPNAEEIIGAMLVAKAPLLKQTIADLLTWGVRQAEVNTRTIPTQVTLLRKDHWITLLTKGQEEKLPHYAEWMIHLAAHDLLSILIHFLDPNGTQGNSAQEGVVSARGDILLLALSEHLPHNVARRRGRDAARMTLISKPKTAQALANAVDFALLRAQSPFPSSTTILRILEGIEEIFRHHVPIDNDTAVSPPGDIVASRSIAVHLARQYTEARSSHKAFGGRFESLSHQINRIAREIHIPQPVNENDIAHAEILRTWQEAHHWMEKAVMSTKKYDLEWKRVYRSLPGSDSRPPSTLWTFPSPVMSRVW